MSRDYITTGIRPRVRLTCDICGHEEELTWDELLQSDWVLRTVKKGTKERIDVCVDCCRH